MSCRKQLKQLFNMHGDIHHFLGQDLPTATNDPVFYLLHSFMELLYKLWMQQKDVGHFLYFLNLKNF